MEMDAYMAAPVVVLPALLAGCRRRAFNRRDFGNLGNGTADVGGSAHNHWSAEDPNGEERSQDDGDLHVVGIEIGLIVEIDFEDWSVVEDRVRWVVRWLSGKWWRRKG